MQCFYFYFFTDIRDIKNITIEILDTDVSIFKHTIFFFSYYATNLVAITLIFKSVYQLFVIKLSKSNFRENSKFIIKSLQTNLSRI